MAVVEPGRSIEFLRPDGQRAPGVLFTPAEGAPGVVLIQEWWGVNDQIRGVGRRLAAAGYRVLIPDLYRGRATAVPDEARHLAHDLDFQQAAEDIAGALAYLKGQAPDARVGVMGFCLGGALTLAALCQIPGFAAGVSYYGVPGPDRADPSRLLAPLQAHFAEFDDWVTPAVVRTVEEQLRRGGTEYELYRYTARHGFFNEERADVHDPLAAAESWRRTLDFLARHLGGPRPTT
jgi:carboxymethylenebutenolidase